MNLFYLLFLFILLIRVDISMRWSIFIETSLLKVLSEVCLDRNGSWSKNDKYLSLVKSDLFPASFDLFQPMEVRTVVFGHLYNNLLTGFMVASTSTELMVADAAAFYPDVIFCFSFTSLVLLLVEVSLWSIWMRESRLIWLYGQCSQIILGSMLIHFVAKMMSDQSLWRAIRPLMIKGWGNLIIGSCIRRLSLIIVVIVWWYKGTLEFLLLHDYALLKFF